MMNGWMVQASSHLNWSSLSTILWRLTPASLLHSSFIGVHPKVRSQSLDDDLGLGADAESVSDSGKGEDLVKTKQVIGPR